MNKSFIIRNKNVIGMDVQRVYTSTPIGIIQAFSGTTIPRGFLLCNGASYKVAEYPDLYAVIGNTYGGDAENFNVPNLVDKFIQGSATSGTEKEAGLPNISGSIYGALTYPNIDNADGVFGESNEQSYGTYGSGGGGISTINLSLNASKSNAIYGNSDTVQPPALTMVYIIKAFHTNEGVDSGVSDDVVEYVEGEIAEVESKVDGLLDNSSTSETSTWSSSKIASTMPTTRSLTLSSGYSGYITEVYDPTTKVVVYNVNISGTFKGLLNSVADGFRVPKGSTSSSDVMHQTIGIYGSSSAMTGDAQFTRLLVRNYGNPHLEVDVNAENTVVSGTITYVTA